MLKLERGQTNIATRTPARKQAVADYIIRAI